MAEESTITTLDDESIFPQSTLSESDNDEVRLRIFSLANFGDEKPASSGSDPSPTSGDDAPTAQLRSQIRKTLLKGLSDESIERSDSIGGCKKCRRRIKNMCSKNVRLFNEMQAANLTIKSGIEAGSWDSWGVYYCSSRFGKHSKINPVYLALAATFIMGQGSMLNLIYYMSEHGGGAFIVVLTLVYISVGYPMYIFETIMGQYSGRKPIQMIRLMLPALSGLGPALYARTLVKACNATATFLYCFHLVFDLFFCKPTEITLVHRFLETEKLKKKFDFFKPSIDHTLIMDSRVFNLEGAWWLAVLTIALFIFVAQPLRELGKMMKVVTRVFMLAVCGYLVVGFSRIHDARPDSIVFLPLRKVLTPEWGNIISGSAWLDAIIFVIQSMELGTLVHPYLGSKSFFHYRSYRDGFVLILLALGWNLFIAIAALIWLGYIGVNKEQMAASSDHLFGHYGLFLVYMLKHMQAEMTQNVQGDTLFFNAFFYSVVGIAALCSLILYLVVMIDCSYPESGHLIVKMSIMVSFVIFFGVFVPMFVLQEEGLRYVIFFNFYAHKSWSVFFIIGSYFVAVAFGHDLGKFIHDFFNIIHLRGYQSKQHSYHLARTARWLGVTFLSIGGISFVFIRPYPHEGHTDWSGDGKYFGMAFSSLPVLSVISIAIYHYTGRHKKERFRPHRDWYKNKHHVAICFADFAKFNGVVGLQDPEMVEKEKADKSRKSTKPDITLTAA